MWSKVSGGGSVTFQNPMAPHTTVTFAKPGNYVLRLTATDGVLSSTDDVAIAVKRLKSANQPPTVNAGSDQTITLPSAATLNGTASDDGQPSGTLVTTWSEVSGPGSVTFGNANALQTTATFSDAGNYVLRLSASDTALTRSDDVNFVVNTASSATMYYVDGVLGNDTNLGTPDAPWRSIQRAANSLQAGDTVVVNAGTYNERVRITTSGTASGFITFQAQGAVMMQGFNIGADYIRVTGFEIANTSGNGWSDRDSGAGVLVGGSNNEILNNYVHNTTSSGIHLQPNASNIAVNGNRIAYAVECGIYSQGTNNLFVSNDISHTRSIGGSDADGVRFFGSGSTFRKNVIHDLTTSDSPGDSPHLDAFQTWGPASNYIFEQNWIDKDPTDHQGFTIEGLTQPVGNIIIRNNVFVTRGTGYQSDVNAGDLGTVTNVSVVNNTMVAINGPAEFAIWLFQYLQGAVVKNNAIFDHGNVAEPYIRVDTGALSLDIGFNSISKSDGLAPTGFAYPNDLWMLNPQFVNMAGGDFHLQPTSPLIRTGATLSQVTNDYDGATRPQGAYDIGAFQYSSGASTSLVNSSTQ